MKKLTAFITAICILLSLSVIYTNAKSGGYLTKWHDKIFYHIEEMEANFAEEHSRLQNTAIEQKESALKVSEAELTSFKNSALKRTKQNMKNYQQEYLSRLTDTKNILGERNFEAYEEQKKKDISLEISNDVEEYLTELLGE